MSLKAQLSSDMENVFMNSNELADTVTIDGVVKAGFLLEHSGEFEERVNVLRVASTTLITSDSVIVVGVNTYGVVGTPVNDGFGTITVVLGKAL